MEGGNRIHDILDHPAAVTEAESIQCDSCDERIVFHLRDSQNRDFAVGLTTMLACIEFAIQQGELPKLSMGWCAAVERAYGLKFDQTIMTWDEKR